MARYLTREEEHLALAKFKATGDKEAIKSVIDSNIGIIYKTAHYYKKFGFDFSELVQEGIIGLLKAASNYDDTAKNKFMSYAIIRVKEHMRRHIVDNWSVVSYHSKSKRDNLFKAGGKTYVKDFSLNKPMTDNSDNSFIDTIEGSYPSPETVAVTKEKYLAVRRALMRVSGSLSPRDKDILHDRYLAEDTLTLEEVGTKLGITRERVRQLERKTLDKLRNEIEMELA